MIFRVESSVQGRPESGPRWISTRRQISTQSLVLWVFPDMTPPMLKFVLGQFYNIRGLVVKRFDPVD